MKVKNLVITGIALLVIVLLIVFGYRAYLNGETSLSIAQMSKKKILITYYTRTNDTSAKQIFLQLQFQLQFFRIFFNGFV